MKKLLTPLLACPIFLSDKLRAAQEAMQEVMQAAAPAASSAAPADQGFTQTLVMVTLALVFFYFILWRPEQKRRKQMESQRNAMRKGDEVVAMGLVGTISKIKEDTFIMRTGDAEVEFLKAAISEVRSVDDKKA